MASQDFNTWLSQRRSTPTPTSAPAPTSARPMSFADWQSGHTAPVAPQPSAADIAVGGGSVDWQGLYDPLQEYYWKTQLGGQNVKTRDLLGYDDPYTEPVENLSLDDIKNTDWYKAYTKPSISSMSGNNFDLTPRKTYTDADWLTMLNSDENGSSYDINLDALRQYGDWTDTNLQDFYTNSEKYRNTDQKHKDPLADISTLLDLGSPDYDAWDTGGSIDFGHLNGNDAFAALTQTYTGDWDYVTQSYLPDSTNWLTEQGIDLREGTGWDPSMGITGEDANTRAIQAGLMTGENNQLSDRIVWNPTKHFMADMTDPSEYKDLAEMKVNMFDPVAGYLNSYGKETGNTDTNFFTHADNTGWDKSIKKANPSSLKKFAQSPVFGAMLGMVTGGLGLVGSAAGGITAATGGAISGGAATALGGAAVGAGTGALGAGLAGGNVGKGALSGAVGGGLGQYAGNYLNNNLVSPVLGDNAFSKAISNGAVGGATNALLGGDFGTGFTGSALNSGVNSITNDYISPTLNQNFDPAVSSWLSKTGGRVLGNVLSGRENDPASLAKASFTDWLSSKSKP